MHQRMPFCCLRSLARVQQQINHGEAILLGPMTSPSHCLLTAQGLQSVESAGKESGSTAYMMAT